MVAPILMHLAMSTGGKPGAGIGTAIWVCFGIAAGRGLIALYLFVRGRARLSRPDLERWIEGEEPAWTSPPLAGGIRGESSRPGLRKGYPLRVSPDQERIGT